MNSKLKKFSLIALVLVLAMGIMACSDGAVTDESSNPAEEGIYEPGTYEATAEGHNGEMKLEVTFDANEITSIEIVEHEESEGISDEAIDTIPQAIIDGQTLNVDAVAGATYTSDAIIEAVSDAVSQAGGDPESLK